MFRALVLALALSASASAAVAQAETVPQAASVEATVIGEAEFRALTEAFERGMQAMQQEMRTAVSDAGEDIVARTAALDAIEERYQPDAEAFASTFEVFIAHKRETASEEERAEIDSGLGEAASQLRAVPRSVRTVVEQEATAPAPAS